MMSRSPFSDKAKSGLGANVANDYSAVQIKLALLTLVLGMEMSRFMLPVKHADNNPEKCGDDWHASILSHRGTW
jgi:hypothetical protein